MDILVYSIEEQQYGLELCKINSVILAVEITPLPHAPDHSLGAINVHGQITLVLDMRKLLGWPKREVASKDQLILCNIHQKQVALWVDSVKLIKHYKEEELIPAKEIFPDLVGLQHVLKDEGLMIFLYDLEKLLPSDSITVTNEK